MSENLVKPWASQRNTHGDPLMDYEPAEVGAEYPKFVEPHPSFVLKRPDGSPCVEWRELYVERDGKLRVIVADQMDETIMTSPKVKQR